jgi:hypothetical protein
MLRFESAGTLLLSALALSCSSGSGDTSGTFYCSFRIAGDSQCSGYSNLTADDQTAEQAACADEMGTVVPTCPTGYVGCCATTTAGYDLKQCYYAGSASTLEATCSGVWTGGSTMDAGTDGPVSTKDAETDSRDTNPNSDASAAIKILSLSSTASRLTSSPSASGATSANIIAIVTDTSGLDNIAGGQLMGEGGVTYAAFGASSEKGTYTATIDWTGVNQESALSFAPPGGSRTFTAKFFDNAGSTATASISIDFFCNPTSTTGACEGTCTDFTANESCGGCTSACGAGEQCVDQSCQMVGFADCMTPSATTATCASVCASAGQSCTANCSDDGMTGLAGIYGTAESAECEDALSPITSCSEAIAELGAVQFACCCTQ